MNGDNIPKCKTCGKEVKWVFPGKNKGYRTYCNQKCYGNDPNSIQRRKDTCLEKYGTVSAFQSPNCLAKNNADRQKRIDVANAKQAERDALADILGMSFVDEKKHHWNSCGASCGTETVMTDTNLSGENKCLRPHDAATLHGRLGYVLGFGKTGRAALQPIVEREHSMSKKLRVE